MVRQSKTQSKQRAHGAMPKRPAANGAPPTQVAVENLDDETKLAKRHLTKEMWQLVSIAVKRMADELVLTTNSSQTPARAANQELPPPTADDDRLVAPTSGQRTGAGDEPAAIKVFPSPQRVTPVQMQAVSSQAKRKAASNNAVRRAAKKNRKTTASHPRSHTHSK